MVTRQSPLSFNDWKAEVAKMHAVYGAPLWCASMVFTLRFSFSEISWVPKPSPIIPPIKSSRSRGI